MRSVSKVSAQIYCVFIVLFLIVTAGCDNLGSMGNAKRMEIGQPAPDFELLDSTGKTWKLSSLKGKVVFVNFWATWCKPCRKEIPDLSELHVQREDIDVIGLAFEEVEAEAILEFLKEYPAAYPIALIDVYEPPEVFGSPMVLPTTVLISPEGMKQKSFLGPITRSDIEDYVADPGVAP